MLDSQIFQSCRNKFPLYGMLGITCDTLPLPSQAGADSTITNANGEKPYDCGRLDAIKRCHHCIRLPWLLLVKLYRLLATGANKLHYNAMKGDVEAVESLIVQEKISVDAESYHGNTALHEASRCGKKDVVEQLLKFGADIDKKSSQSGCTALHLASAGNHKAVVEVLLLRGAKRDIKDNEGKVPFEVACSHEMRKALMKKIDLSHERHPSLANL